MSDAIILGGEFVSEHYFGTDATRQSFKARVLARRKAWDEARSTSDPTTRSRYIEERDVLAKYFAALAERTVDLPELYEKLRGILGYGGMGLDIEPMETVLTVRAKGLTGPAPLVLVEAEPNLDLEKLLDKDSETLRNTFLVDEKTELKSVARLLSHLFVAEDGPQFVLVFAGSTVLLAERERWAEGRYLAVDLQLVGERAEINKRAGEVDTALTCIGAESLAPDAEGNIWWTEVFEESVKHTVGVSQDLREGVRLSIEIIANEVVNRRRDKGLAPLPQDQAQVLAQQSLRFLYRILFLLYAEASPELGVLPIGEPAYERGYSLDRLRDLTLTELAGPRALNGTHLYESLAVLFKLIDSGHDGGRADDETGSLREGLTFNALKADLFLDTATKHIDDVKLGNGELQRVLRHLLLSKKQSGRDRGFISYAELGINQLGAVYEGLMSYTGFFAGTDLYEVAKNGDASKGSWVVPHDRIEGISPADFVKAVDEHTGENKPVVHARGTFVFRLAGRERQQSASYYTPEVLTRFTVGQALEELLDQGGRKTTAREILDLTVCEPALGSGAFAIEAVRQLAEGYLTRRQDELGERVDPDAYSAELQKVKAYLALHQVYGVDLNGTAVEFAEISLWLATMGEGLAAPWFGLHLKRGNSLIGARRSVIPSVQLKGVQWMSATPVDKRLGDEIPSGAVHHFLIPSSGWGSSVDAKEAKSLAPEALARLKVWQRSIKGKLSKQQTDRLQSIALRVERVWELAARRLEIAEQQIRRHIPIWGADGLPYGGRVSRQEIEHSLANVRGAYRRLRRVMDAWCALWFWPLTDDLTTVNDQVVQPPSVDQWIEGCEMLLGKTVKIRPKNAGQAIIDAEDEWQSLGVTEDTDFVYAGAVDPVKALAAHPWLVVCERIALRYGFFHWELDFAPVFAKGGFDLQVGNPPWVRPRSDVEALLAEADPWWQLKAKSNATQDAEHRKKALAIPGTRELLLDGTAEVAAIAAFVGSPAHYPHLAGLQPDLYRCFMEQTWRNARSTGSACGSIGLIHPETHFTDEKAGPLRRATYTRLRRHWQFNNARLLFKEIKDNKRFGTHVYGAPQPQVEFLHATNLYHPDTILRSFLHDGSGPEPGLRTAEGKWDVSPHKSRIIRVTHRTLQAWHKVLDLGDTPIVESKMLFNSGKALNSLLERSATLPRLVTLNPEISAGWIEGADTSEGGTIDVNWGTPTTWNDVVIHGSFLHVARPFYQFPNETMRHNQDTTEYDLEALSPTSIPITSFKPRVNADEYRSRYGTAGHNSSPLDFFRIIWRTMADNVGRRTLMPSLIPPRACHVDSICALLFPASTGKQLALTCAYLSSLTSDALIRIAPKSTIRRSAIERLPAPVVDSFADELILRILRLSCVTEAYATLWKECWEDNFGLDAWTGGISYPGRPALGSGDSTWTPTVPLRRASDRRQALLEIDVLVGISLGLSAEDIVGIYRSAFPLLYTRDQKELYDACGRLVPTRVVNASKNGRLVDTRGSLEEVHPGSGVVYAYQLPFRTLHRDEDIAAAYAAFAARSARG